MIRARRRHAQTVPHPLKAEHVKGSVDMGEPGARTDVVDAADSAQILVMTWPTRRSSVRTKKFLLRGPSHRRPRRKQWDGQLDTPRASPGIPRARAGSRCCRCTAGAHPKIPPQNLQQIIVAPVHIDVSMQTSRTASVATQRGRARRL